MYLLINTTGAIPESTLPLETEAELTTPPSIKPSTRKSSLTILTDADVTYCRPFPNIALHPKQGTTYGRGTSLKLTCWTYNDTPGSAVKEFGPKERESEQKESEPKHREEEGDGKEEPRDIWVKTGSYGCFINENDLGSWNIDFEEELGYCAAPGPHRLSGNRPVGGEVDPSLMKPEFGEIWPPLSANGPPNPGFTIAPGMSAGPLAPEPPASPLPPVSPPSPVSPLQPAPPLAPVQPALPMPLPPIIPAVTLPAPPKVEKPPGLIPLVNASQPLTMPKVAPNIPKPDNSTKIAAKKRTGISQKLF